MKLFLSTRNHQNQKVIKAYRFFSVYFVIQNERIFRQNDLILNIKQAIISLFNYDILEKPSYLARLKNQSVHSAEF